MSTRQLARRPQQLPLIPEDKRAYVVDFARSALFCVGGKSPRTRFENRMIAAWPTVQIEYSGMELRDDDQDVLIALIHKARGMSWHPTEGIRLDFTGLELLRELDWPNTSGYYQKLRDCLDRLQGGSVTVRRRMESGKLQRHRGQLIRKFSEVEVEGSRYPRWVVWIESETAELFATEDRRLELEWGERKELSKPISKWLHAFIWSMTPDPEEWFVIAEPTLFMLTGSKATEPRTIRALVKSGLEEMLTKKVIAAWRIHQELVYVALKPGLDIDRATAAAAQKLFTNVLTFDGATDIDEVAA